MDNDIEQAKGAKTQTEVSIDLTKELREDFKILKGKIRLLRDRLGDNNEAMRCISLSYTEAQSARHWLGEVLGALGAENPYKE